MRGYDRGNAEVAEMAESEEEPRNFGHRVRLPFITWGRLGLLAAILGIGAMLVGDEDAQVSRWDQRLDGHLGLIDTLQFSADGGLLLSSGWDRTVRIWDVGLGDGEPREGGRQLACLNADEEFYATALSPDGEAVAIAGQGGVSLWDWNEDERRTRPTEVEGSTRTLEFSPDGRILAIGTYDRTIQIVDVATGKRLLRLRGQHDTARKLAFMGDSRKLAAVGYDGRVSFWDLDSGREFDAAPGLNSASRRALAIAVSPTEDLLAVSRIDERHKGVEVWSLKDGRIHAVSEALHGDSHALEFSRDGRILAAASGDGGVRLCDPHTGRALGRVASDDGRVRALDFSSDGRWMAVTSAPDRVWLKRMEPAARLTVTASQARPKGRA